MYRHWRSPKEGKEWYIFTTAFNEQYQVEGLNGTFGKIPLK